MDRRLPPWVTTHGAAHDDAEQREHAALTPAQRWERFAQVSRLAALLFAANDHRDAAAALRDERSPESLALWQRLMAAHRRG